MKTIRLYASLLIILSLLIGLLPMETFATGSEDVFGTIPAGIVGNGGYKLDLKVRVKGEKVYANAEQLGHALGYIVTAVDNRIVFSNTDSRSNSLGLTVFTSGSLNVRHSIGPFLLENYEAPFESIYDDSGAWVPLSYTCRILKGNCSALNGMLLISMPERNIMDDYHFVAENKQYFLFNLCSEESWDAPLKELQIAIEHNNRVLAEFMDLLVLNGEKLTDLGMFFTSGKDLANLLDYSLGKELAALICVNGQEELINTLSVAKTGNDAIKDIVQTLTFSDDIAKQFSTSELNKCIEELVKVCKGSKGMGDFTALGIKLSSMQDTAEKIRKAESALDGIENINVPVLEIFSNALDVWGYMADYENADEFALSALTPIINNAKDKWLSAPTVDAISTCNEALQADMATYSLVKFLQQDAVDTLDAFIGFTDIAKPAGFTYKAIQLSWDLSRNYIPFLKNGLDAAKEIELSLLASNLQAAAMEQYQSELIPAKTSGDAAQLYRFAQSFYVYLKAGYVARNTALHYSELKLGKDHPDVITLSEAYEYHNKKTEEILARLRMATPNNSNGEYGFLPADNQKYLKTWTDATLLTLVVPSETTPPPEEMQDDPVPADGIPAQYLPILDSYYTALRDGEKIEETEEMGLSCLINHGDLDTIGYCCMDINTDGMPELLISGVDNNGLIYDMYTAVGADLVRCCKSAERGQYSLCEKGKLEYYNYDRGGLCQWGYYELSNNGELTLIEALSFGGWEAKTTPWFYCYTEEVRGFRRYFTDNYDNPISEEDFDRIKDSYPHQTIYYTPFTQYTPNSNTAQGKEAKGIVKKIEITLDHDGSYEFGTITAYDSAGNAVWSYDTPKNLLTELRSVTEIGQRDGRYYFAEDGSIVCLDVQTGEMLWRNRDYSGRVPGFAFGENAIYLCGYYGPDFFAINYDGTTLARIERFDQQFYWPREIELLGDYAVVHLHGGTDQYDSPIAFYIDLQTYSYSASLDELKPTRTNSTSWPAAYVEVLHSHPAYTRFTYTVDGETKTINIASHYALYDIDKNGIPELIVQEDGTDYFFYTYEDNSALLCGKEYFSYADCLYASDEDVLLVHGGGSGFMHFEYVWSFFIYNGKLEDQGYVISTEEVSYEDVESWLLNYENIPMTSPVYDYTLLYEWQ